MVWVSPLVTMMATVGPISTSPNTAGASSITTTETGHLPVISADCAQHTYAIVETEGQRSAGRARHDTAVNRPLRRWSTPRGVSANIVRGGNSPQIFAVAGELVVKRKAEQLVRLGGL